MYIFTSLHLGSGWLGVLPVFMNYARLKRTITKYVPVKSYCIPGYTCVSEEYPVDPLKPCSVPGRTVLPGRSQCTLVDKYLDQKVAAASPSPPLGVSIHLRVHWDTHWKYGLPRGSARFQGVHWVSIKSESLFRDMVRFQGYVFCNCSFVCCIIN